VGNEERIRDSIWDWREDWADGLNSPKRAAALQIRNPKVLADGHVLNPKSETRNPKQIQISKKQCSKLGGVSAHHWRDSGPYGA